MDLSLQIIPAGDTTAHEVAAASQEVRRALERMPGVADVVTRRVAAPDGAKGAVVDALGGLLVSVAPWALKALTQAVQTVLARQPQTEILIETKDGKFTFRFDPKKIGLQELGNFAQQLRGAAQPP